MLQSKFQAKDSLYSELRQYETILKTRGSLVLELSGKRKLCDEYRTRSERLNKEIENVRVGLSKYVVYDKIEPLLSNLSGSLEIAKVQSVQLSAIERSRAGCGAGGR